MIILNYSYFGRELLLTETDKDEGALLEYRIPEAEGGTLKIGKTTVKITNGVGRVEFSRLSHGNHRPVLTMGATRSTLDEISVFSGKAELCSVTEDKLCYNRALVALNKRLTKVEGLLAKLCEAAERKIF